MSSTEQLTAVRPNDLQRVFVCIGRQIFWCEYLATYDVICGNTGLPRKEAMGYVKQLKELGVVVRGFGVDDDGMMAGSGFYVPDEHKPLFEQADEAFVAYRLKQGETDELF